MRTTIGKAGFKEYTEQMLSWLLGGSVSAEKESPVEGVFPRKSRVQGK